MRKMYIPKSFLLITAIFLGLCYSGAAVESDILKLTSVISEAEMLLHQARLDQDAVDHNRMITLAEFLRSNIMVANSLNDNDSINSSDSRDALNRLAVRLEEAVSRSTYSFLEIPCVEIKQFQASRKYLPYPFHKPYGDWEFSELSGPEYQVGIKGSFESKDTGADSSYWWKLWIRFDLSFFEAMPYSTVVDAEIVMEDINVHWGAGEGGDGMSVRLFKLFDDSTGQYMLSPSRWQDADTDYNPIAPSQSGTPYDQTESALVSYGYGSMNEIARISTATEQVDSWQKDGNYGLIIGCQSLSVKDYGHRFHIREIKPENITLKLKIRH